MSIKGILKVVAVALILSACGKDKGGSRVYITVVNEKGVPIQNCNVKLTVPVDNSLVYYGVTDEDGKITFGSGVDSYYDCYVWKGLWEGCDYVHFVPGESTNRNIIIFPPGSTFNGCI